MAASSLSLKSISELACSSWDQGVPNPFQGTSTFSTTFTEALSYLEQIAKITTLDAAFQDVEAFSTLKSRCWEYIQTIKNSDEYLKAVATCWNCLRPLPKEKEPPSVTLIFKDGEFLLPFYIQHFLKRIDPHGNGYFNSLLAGWSQDARSSKISIPELCLDDFLLILGSLKLGVFPWISGASRLKTCSAMTDEELLKVIRAADYMGLPAIHLDSINQLIQHITNWHNNRPAEHFLLAYTLLDSSIPGYLQTLVEPLKQYIDKSFEAVIAGIEKWSTKDHFKTAKQIMKLNLWNSKLLQPSAKRLIPRALIQYSWKALELAEDADELSKSLKPLTNWPITVLKLPGKLMGEEHIQQINRFTSLQTLSISDRAEVEDLIAFDNRGVTELQFIRCRNVSKTVLKYLGTLSSIKTLAFEKCEIQDKHLFQLKPYNIHTLRLANCPLLTPSGLGHLRTLPLKALNIIHCFGNDLEALVHIKAMQNLEDITLDIAYLRDLSFLKGCTLKVLKILNYNFSNPSSMAKSFGLFSIDQLVLSGQWVTESLIYSLRNIKIKKLCLDQCPMLSKESQDNFLLTNWRAEPTENTLLTYDGHCPDLISLSPGVIATIHFNETFYCWRKIGPQWIGKEFKLHLPNSAYSQWSKAYICAIGTLEGYLAFFSYSPGNREEGLDIDIYNQEGSIVNKFYCDSLSHTWHTIPFTVSLNHSAPPQFGQPKKIKSWDDIPIFREDKSFEIKKALSKSHGLYPLKRGFATLCQGKNGHLSFKLGKGEIGAELRLSLPDHSTDSFKDIIELTNGAFVTLSTPPPPSILSFGHSRVDYHAKIILWSASGVVLKEIQSNEPIQTLRALHDGSFVAFGSFKPDSLAHFMGQWDQNGELLLAPPSKGQEPTKHYLAEESLELGYGCYLDKDCLKDQDNTLLRKVIGSCHIQVDDRTLAGFSLEKDKSCISIWEFPPYIWGQGSADTGAADLR